MNKFEPRIIFALFAALFLFSVHGSSQHSVNDERDRIITTAQKYIGTTYRYGGTGSGGFDCSGFVAQVYSELGIALPRSSLAQYNAGMKISFNEAKPGDLVFFAINGKDISHVGIYMGENKFIHAPSSGKKIMISDITTSYWSKRFAGTTTYFKGK